MDKDEEVKMNVAKRELKRVHTLFTNCAPIFFALGDEQRQHLMLSLIDAGKDGLNVSSISETSTLSRPAVSHHLKILKDCDFVVSEKVGTQIFYKINFKKNLDTVKNLISSIENIVEKMEFVQETKDQDQKQS